WRCRHDFTHGPESISVRHLPLYLPYRASARQPDPVRPRALFVEKRFLTNAAQRPTASGFEPVSLRGDRGGAWAFCRLFNARTHCSLADEPDPTHAAGHD